MRLRIAFLALLLLPVAGRATTLLHVPLERLARDADQVLRGVVTGSHVDRDPRSGILVTVWTLEVGEDLTGRAAPERIEVITLGGRQGEIRQQVAGAAELRLGGHYALFLSSLGGGRGRVLAMQQGAFRLRPDAAQPEALVVERAGGLTVYDPASDRYQRLDPVRIDLDAFRQLVQQARSTR